MEIKDFEQRLRELEQAKKLIEKEEKQIKDTIKKAHTSNANATYGGVQVQVSAEYYGLEFDLDTFKTEHNDLYEQYQKLVHKLPIVKVVLVKEKGGKE